MTAKLAREGVRKGVTADALKGWAMLALALGFLLLHAAALAGLVRFPENDRLVGRLEPLVFVIAGYFFGRLPSQQNERTLKDEINRQTQRADAAHHAREQSQQSRDALEEKLKNVRAALTTPSRGAGDTSADGTGRVSSHVEDEHLRGPVATALNVINS
ncbi:MAG TPA: hypothetical protein VE642_05190 [Pyrinomonadaceae bacterium]|jgi:hypothetical protein|nr:hypothetical protein [Pyrinomonadaceae bacterium]